MFPVPCLLSSTDESIFVNNFQRECLFVNSTPNYFKGIGFLGPYGITYQNSQSFILTTLSNILLLLALTFFLPTQLYSKHESFITIVYCHYSCFGVAFANSFSLSPLQQIKMNLLVKFLRNRFLIWREYGLIINDKTV